MVQFLRELRDERYLENTLLLVMGDHGPRYAELRDTLQGKLEERLPLMAIRLPDMLRRLFPFQTKIFSMRYARTYKTRIYVFLLTACIIGICVWMFISGPETLSHDSTHRLIEKRLEDALKEDKGTGCSIPVLDPFAKEVTQFDKDLPKIVCTGEDWVRCYHHECRVTKSILAKINDITCYYRDIIYLSDVEYVKGKPTKVEGDRPYVLQRSDHVMVKCKGRLGEEQNYPKWSGNVMGLRSLKHPPLVDRGGAIDVLIFGYDSSSRNGFIRRMPKSYRFITKELNMTVLKGYNIVGDGTPAALFPILTGRNELEHAEARRSQSNGTINVKDFIFYKMENEGYRTAYFEDMPWIGTFQYRFNGFNRQPAEHYLRAFFQEEFKKPWDWFGSRLNKYCVGDTPSYMLMMNITKQFFKLPGKHFAFTFIGDICHDDYNVIPTADEDTVQFLRELRDEGYLENTLLLVMGDHGPRYAELRDTLQGKLEERLPLMAIRLPDMLRRSRPDAQVSLDMNVNTLTTPYDIYATVLDAVGLNKHQNLYKIKGADLNRGLSLLKPIPRSRSCSEAAIEPHWCACLTWENVTRSDKLYDEAVNSFVDYINSLTEPVRSQCAIRALVSVGWVSRRRANSRLLAFQGARDADGYEGKFEDRALRYSEHYQIKVTVGPGHGIYEASAIYEANKFKYTIRDISRVNPYFDEPSCISARYPHLDKYCYCKP